MKRCRHDFGWECKKQTNLFVDTDGTVKIGWQDRQERHGRVKFVCNRANCGAERYIYIEAEIIRLGPIHRPTAPKEAESE